MIEMCVGGVYQSKKNDKTVILHDIVDGYMVLDWTHSGLRTTCSPKHFHNSFKLIRRSKSKFVDLQVEMLKFEKWASEEKHSARFPLAKKEDGMYKDYRTHTAWYAWQGRALTV